MAEDTASVASAASEEPPSSLSPVDGDWRSVVPGDGDMEYVQALQMLGIHMASSCPSDLKTAAITPLGVEPQTDLLRGDFKAKTKERTLILGCTSVQR